MNASGMLRLRVGIALCTLAGGVSTLACSGRPAPPHIVLVVLDTVRSDFTGSSPGRVTYTPNLDRLADTGTAFTRAFSTAPWTVPSHASLFTGLLPQEHGCNSLRIRLAEGVPTLAELLGAAGYRTAAFYSNPWLSDRLTGLLRGFDTKHESPIGEIAASGSDQGGPATVDALDAWLANHSPSTPCFLFVNFLEAHLSYDPPEAYRREHLSEIPLEESVTVQYGMQFNAGLHDPAEIDWPRVRRLYGGDVFTADRFLGELLASLERHGFGDNTVILVTSDHGENLGDHDLMDHQFSVHETLLSVPLVIRAPGRLAAGVREDPVMLTDLFNTMLELAGVDPPHRTFARSTIEPGEPDRPVLADYAGGLPIQILLLEDLNPELDHAFYARPRQTVRRGPYRLNVSGSGDPELYDLDRDPEQLENVAGEHPEVVASLREILEKAEGERRVGLPDRQEIDARLRERLRSLGYTN